MDKTIRNELMQELTDINLLIQSLEGMVNIEKATDNINQLLYAYDVKLKIINELNNI